MEDKGKTFAELDKEAIDSYNKRLVHDQERNAKFYRQWEWRGDKLPPFSIEPMASERQRLVNGGMTPEQRAARKQWLADQKLAHNEPRYVPELYPRNVFKRVWSGPWDAMYWALRPATVSFNPRIIKVRH